MLSYSIEEIKEKATPIAECYGIEKSDLRTFDEIQRITNFYSVNF